MLVNNPLPRHFPQVSAFSITAWAESVCPLGPEGKKHFYFYFILLDIFFIYISNAILKVPYTLPSPPAPQPTHSCVLAPACPYTGAYNLLKTKGPLIQMMAH